MALYSPPAYSRTYYVPRFLWPSLIAAIIACISSMILLGALSLWLTPSSFLITVIFDTTLLVLHSKDEKRRLRQATKVELPLLNAYSQPAPVDPPNPHTYRPDLQLELPLPHALRISTIAFTLFLLLPWLASAGVLLYFFISTFLNGIGGHPLIAAPVVELNCVLAQVALLSSFASISLKERRRWVSNWKVGGVVGA